MLVLTVQKYEVLQQVYSQKGYSPKFWKSDYAFLSPRYSKGYKKVLNALSCKTGRYYDYGEDSCMWGWVCNQYLGFYHSNENKCIKDRMYAVICDIPEDEMVLSDYDEFCSYVQEDKDFCAESMFIEKLEGNYSKCIQCSFWNLNKEDIKLVIDLDYVMEFKNNSKMSIEDIYDALILRDESYLFNGSLSFLDLVFNTDPIRARSDKDSLYPKYSISSGFLASLKSWRDLYVLGI